MKKKVLIITVMLISLLFLLLGCDEKEEILLENSFENSYIIMSYPESWTVQSEDWESGIRITNFISQDDEIKVNISMDILSEELSEDDIYRFWEEEIEEEEAKGDFLHHEKRERESRTSYVVHYNSMPGERTFQYMTAFEGYVVILEARTPIDNFNDILPTIEGMVDSLVFKMN